ncbi:Crp/Fnr family transcriptional regulator [Bacteroides pyogenes]|uniref:Crp/Fnr family transcriptional regulator n=1 Tax=Bacteroides pyogenes TaxID=310300 RepID=UPI000688B372
MSKKQIPEETIELIMQKGVCMCLSKGTPLIRERDIEHYLYYIEKGCCRFFTVRERDAEEITFQFAFEGEFVNSLLSFKTGQPSAFTIETLAPCEIWAFHKKHWEDLIEKAPVIKQLFQDILEELFIAKLQREMQMLKYSPEELYLFLINSNPIIFKEAPLKYIATYLGITPQSLCRLRNRIARRRS